LEADGEQTPIDASAATPPSLRNTWFIALFGKIFRREAQPGVAIQAGDSDDETETGSGTGSDMPELEHPDQERDAKNIKSGKTAPVSLKGGARRRRKAARK
jgi:DnaJ homolog subfamily C member 1